MISDALSICIDEMKEIKDLEKAASDTEKQQKIDTTFSVCVNEICSVVDATESCRNIYPFKPSIEQREKIKVFLQDCEKAIQKGVVQEAASKSIQLDAKKIRTAILQEWTAYYSSLTGQKISMLQTVKGITPDKNKTEYAIGKIQKGASWNYDQQNILTMKKGMDEAARIVNELGLDDTILAFLKKVADGDATVYDLSTYVLSWLQNEKLQTKIKLVFS